MWWGHSQWVWRTRVLFLPPTKGRRTLLVLLATMVEDVKAKPSEDPGVLNTNREEKNGTSAVTRQSGWYQGDVGEAGNVLQLGKVLSILIILLLFDSTNDSCGEGCPFFMQLTSNHHEHTSGKKQKNKLFLFCVLFESWLLPLLYIHFSFPPFFSDIFCVYGDVISLHGTSTRKGLLLRTRTSSPCLHQDLQAQSCTHFPCPCQKIHPCC